MVCDIRKALTLSTLLGLGVTTQHVSAADAAPQAEAAVSPPAGAALEVDSPSLEFLEFLGQWETDDGEWIAPEDLANENFVELIDSALETGLEPDDIN